MRYVSDAPRREPVIGYWKRRCFFQAKSIVICTRRRALFDIDVIKVNVQLLSNKGRQGGAHPLAHFRARGDDCHPIAVDEDIRCDGCFIITEINF